MSTKELKHFINKYSAEIKISVVITIVSTIFSIIAGVFTQTSSPRMIIDVAMGSLAILLLLAILFNLKRLITNLIFNAPLLKIQIDDLFRKDMYRERLKHFSKEKDLLAEVLVKTILPKTIKKICTDNPEITMLNIILDSGTTITPIFKELIYRGINHNVKENLIYSIFTNNLAGIDEIHRINSEISRMGEREFNLIGGQPLNTYRATTGKSTQDFLKTIWESQNQNENMGKQITLSILTANWFICGEDYRKIALCAKGEGHFDFKKDIITNSHYIILVSPLGKLLPMDKVETLNELVPTETGEQYCSFTIPNDKKDRTFLLTSLRPKETSSPISEISLHLKKYIEEETRENNYILFADCPIYTPEGDKYEVAVTEVPHQYIRDNFQNIFFTDFLKN